MVLQVCVPHIESKGDTQGHKAIGLFTFVTFIATAGQLYLPRLQLDSLREFCHSCMSCVLISLRHHSGSLPSVMNFVQPPILSLPDTTRLCGLSALGSHRMAPVPRN